MLRATRAQREKPLPYASSPPPIVGGGKYANAHSPREARAYRIRPRVVRTQAT